MAVWWARGLSVGARPYWGDIIVLSPAAFKNRALIREALRAYPGVVVIKNRLLPVSSTFTPG